MTRRALNVSVGVTGVSAALRELKRVDPEMRKKIPNQFKKAAQPLVMQARMLVPSKPLSGWKPGGRTGWKPGTVRSSIRLKFRATPRKGQREFSVLTLSSGKSPALQIYDMAGRKRKLIRTAQGRAFVKALKEQEGKASRVMWEAVERQKDFIQAEIDKIVRDIEDRLNRDLEKAG